MSKAIRYPPIVASINAAEGHGKTSWLLSAPKPLEVFHIDPNTTQLVEKAVRDNEIEEGDVRLHEVTYPASVFHSKDELGELASTTWEEEFIVPLQEVLRDDDVRTIGLDTGTEIFELLLFADHGKTVQIMQELRTKTNYKYKGLLQALKRSGKHIVLLHRTKEFWESKLVNTSKGEEERRDKVPGMYEREGFNKTGFHVNVEAYLMYEPSRGPGSQQYGMRVSRCLERPSLVTQQADEKAFWDLDDDAWWFGREKIGSEKVKRASFPYLAMQMYPKSTLGDWQ